MPSKAFEHFLNHEEKYAVTALQTPLPTVEQSVHAIFSQNTSCGNFRVNPCVPRDGEN